MRLKNIECQLTQGQLTRYLRGDALSDTAIEQLESHLSECDDCTEYLDELKEELMPNEPVVDEDLEEELAPASPEPAKGNGPRFLVDAIRFKREKLDEVVRPIASHAVIETSLEPTPQAKTYLKPLLYSIGLAAVMVGMTTIMRDPTKLFGERLDNKLPPTASAPGTAKENPASNSSAAVAEKLEPTNVTPVVTPTIKTAEENGSSPGTKHPAKSEEPVAATTSEGSKQKPLPPVTPGPKKRSEKPNLRRTRTTQRRTTNAVARQTKPSTSVPRNGIRVYDGTGNPVNN